MSLLLLLLGAEGEGTPEEPATGGRRYFPTYGEPEADPLPAANDEWLIWWD